MTTVATEEKVRTHYSDEELVEFRELILIKLEKAKGDLALLREAIKGNPNGTEGTSPSFKTIDDAQDVQMKEENTSLALREEKIIQSLKNALIRIENKTYGICHETGKLISKERLRSVPHTTHSMEAKLKKKAA
jgi:RNA polymerase-binding transcription factor DksA